MSCEAGSFVLRNGKHSFCETWGHGVPSTPMMSRTCAGVYRRAVGAMPVSCNCCSSPGAVRIHSLNCLTAVCCCTPSIYSLPIRPCRSCAPQRLSLQYLHRAFPYRVSISVIFIRIGDIKIVIFSKISNQTRRNSSPIPLSFFLLAGLLQCRPKQATGTFQFFRGEFIQIVKNTGNRKVLIEKFIRIGGLFQIPLHEAGTYRTFIH